MPAKKKSTKRTPARRATKKAAPAPRKADAAVETLKSDILQELFSSQARFPEVATKNDIYLSLAYAVRARMLHRWIDTSHTYFHQESRTVVYLSAEYLMGPQLGNNLINLGLMETARKAVAAMGFTLDELLEHEEEPGLGNGGLGRLAACYLDAMATCEIPAMGYGIRYEYGIFDQELRDGWQAEVTDKWLRFGNPWEISHPEIEYRVKLGGRTEGYTDDQGHYRVRWIPERMVRGTAYDTCVLGYGVNTANMLRLWRAGACEDFDLQAFNSGDYYRAVQEHVRSENISRVLYPNDQSGGGKQLRLEQEYFLVSCSLQDMIRIYRQRGKNLASLHLKYAAQLNDTHPALAVAELMRLLVDEHYLEWDEAWDTVRYTFAYTNHTLLPEALEKWPLPLFARVLPRHLEIIYEINRRFMDQVQLQYPGDSARASRLSLIEEGGEKHVRMANLACVGGFKINGVSALHSELLTQTVLKDFFELWPDKFTNVTNGVTPRRFAVLANPGLTRLVSREIGTSWIRHLDDLRRLEKRAGDAGFHEEWRAVKRANKVALADVIKKLTGMAVDPDSLFDVQVKRIHEYKRQHLNVLHILTLYHRLKQNPGLDMTPRTFIFGGKAAPGYTMAKLIIKLITSVAETVNNDPDVKGRIRVVFFPDFNVKNAQRIYPAAELSEQISTAGKEASGTGNMKFMLNGALTIGTLDGANVEIREEAGAENFFLFGLNAEEVARRKAEGYAPWDLYHANPDLRAVIDLIGSGAISGGDAGLFQPIVRSLMDRDDYLLFADYASYIERQDEVSRLYRDHKRWTRMSILNTARSGKFSSDRSIGDYCEQIWNVKPVKVALSSKAGPQ